MPVESGHGARVRSLRRRAGLSQAKLAKMLNISASYLNMIEHDRRPLPAHLMFRAADVLGVDVRAFATDEVGRLHGELMDLLSDPVFDDDEIKAVDVRELCETQPALGRALVKVYTRWKDAEETTRKLVARRLLGKTLEDLDAGEGEAAGEALGSRLPSEEVNDLVQKHRNHFPELEAAAESLWGRFGLSQSRLFEGLDRILAEEHGVTVVIQPNRAAGGVVRQYDPTTRTLSIAETLPPRSRHFHMAHQLGVLALPEVLDHYAAEPQLTQDASRRMCRMVLASYFAGAMLMPYASFLEAAQEVRYDVELLGHRFRTSFEQVCHRLTSLSRKGAEGIPFHLVKTDTAGNVSKRFSGSGIQFARFGGGCPKWNVNTAFMTPGRIRIQLSRMPDGELYFCLARTVAKRHGGFHSPETIHAIGLGCKVEYADRVVYADGLDLDRHDAVEIGTNCRVCDRLGCEQRAFPSLRHPLELDEHVRRVAFYATEDPDDPDGVPLAGELPSGPG